MIVGVVALAGATEAALASTSVTVRGVFRPIHADSRLSESKLYAVEADNGLLYELTGQGEWRQTLPGARIEVRGEQEGDVIRPASVSELAPPRGGAPPAPVTGSRRVLVINVVWSGATLRGTPAQELAFLFGSDPQRRSTKQYYEDVSYGQLSLTGSATANLTIPYPGSCTLDGTLSTIANSADSAARGAGHDLSAYDYTMYSIPASDCPSAGWGEVGGRRSWIVDSGWNLADGYTRLVQAHELGHNFGEWHGHGLECGTSVVTAACLGSNTNIVEYGAAYDVMGNNWTANSYGAVNWMALPHQINLGWATGGGRVVTTRYPGPTQTTNYVIKPIESATGTVGLVVDTPARKYFLEGRSAVGQDSFLSNWPDTTSGVLLSMRNDVPASDTGPLSLDTSPTLSVENNDFFDAALGVGESFSDLEGTFTLTLDGVTTNGAAVRIAPRNVGGDTTPPDTTITAGPSGTTNSTSATFSFTSTEAGSTFECALDAGAFAACSSPKALTGLSEGPHLFSVRAKDSAGNTDASPATRSWIVDTLSPDITPPDTTITAGPTGTTSSTSATFAFTSTEAGSTFECRLDGRAFAACASPKTVAGLSVGAHRFSVRAKDSAGNTDPSPATRDWSVDTSTQDTTAPDTTITAGPSFNTTSSSASFSFTSTEANSTFECAVDAGAFAACSSPKALAGLSDGLHTFSVRATDTAGNTDASPATWTWNVDTFFPDTTPPDTTITAGPSGTTSSASATFSFTSTEAGSTFECALDAGAFAACSSPKALAGLSDGLHTFSVRATDSAGNTDASPATWSWIVDTLSPDTTPPDTTITAGPTGTTSSTSATFAFTSTEAGSTFECRVDGRAFGACASPKTVAGLSFGAHRFSVRAKDSAGNTDPSPATRDWTVSPAAAYWTPW